VSVADVGGLAKADLTTDQRSDGIGEQSVADAVPIAAGLPAVVPSADLAWTVLQMRAGERIIVNEALIAAYQAASSPHSIRALKSDLAAFDAWCRRANRIALPATAETVADYLDARAGKGSRPASLGRYKASIAKIHQLLDLKDPTPASLVKLRLQDSRSDSESEQRQTIPRSLWMPSK
jgi:hypothetical protein